MISQKAFSYKNATWMTCFAMIAHIGNDNIFSILFYFIYLIAAYALMACYLLTTKENFHTYPALSAIPLAILIIGVGGIVGYLLKGHLRRCFYRLIRTNQV